MSKSRKTGYKTSSLAAYSFGFYDLKGCKVDSRGPRHRGGLEREVQTYVT